VQLAAYPSGTNEYWECKLSDFFGILELRYCFDVLGPEGLASRVAIASSRLYVHYSFFGGAIMN
jgi:hypothetical protein